MGARFSYAARNLQGARVEGIRSAENEAALAADLARESLFLIRAFVARATAVERFSAPSMKRKELAAFFVHLGSYIEAGVPLLAALTDYQEPGQPEFNAALLDMRRRVEGGSSLSEAFEAYPSLFQPMLISMIRAGESSGHLDESIREVVKLVEWEEQFAGQVKQAATYPLIVLTIVALVVVLVSIFALPPVLRMLVEFQVPLPLVTRIFILLGQGMVAWGWILIVVPPLVLWLFRMALNRRRDFRLWWHTRLLHIPLLGTLLVKLGLSRFATFFAAQYRAGLPILQILRECASVTGNDRLGWCVRKIREGIESGERLGVMAAQVGYFPPLVVRMFSIGEEAGNLETTLAKVSTYFDAEVQAGLKRFFQMLEPLLLISLAGIVVFVAVSILLPIYSLIGGINASAK
ncbi:MAG: type II secretion system F family protein [Geothrix sp.]|nr:type II secretion system F family protein [Geothrix sp.]